MRKTTKRPEWPYWVQINRACTSEEEIAIPVTAESLPAAIKKIRAELLKLQREAEKRDGP